MSTPRKGRAAAAQNTAPGAPTTKRMPSLGDIVHVVVPEGTVLINNETGARFATGQRTPVTVTPTRS